MPELPHPVIAVDGTAASGKSTFSRELAKRLGYVYVSTGAMYRGVTWYLQEKNVPLNDADSVVREVHAVEIETRLENGHLLFRIGGIDPLSHARESRVNEGVSLVAQIAEIRQLLVAGQQSLAAQSPLVMEGRDIGTVVGRRKARSMSSKNATPSTSSAPHRPLPVRPTRSSSIPARPLSTNSLPSRSSISRLPA